MHGAFRERRDWYARIVGIRAGMWHVISFRAHTRIVDKSRVLGRGVMIDLGNCSSTEQFHDSSICGVLLWKAVSRCVSRVCT